MQSNRQGRWLLATIALAVIVLVGWRLRAGAERWTRARLAEQYLQELAAMSEHEAALLVARLADADDEHLDLVVLALTDERPAVADAAEQAIAGRVRQWSHWPAPAASPRVAALADLLNRNADRIAAQRRSFVQGIAVRLLEWPIDGQLVDATRLIGNCEALLRLPTAPVREIRVAASPAPEPTADAKEFTLPLPAPAALPPSQVAVPPPEPSRPVFAQPPAPLADANRESPTEPRQFLAPRAARISDE